MALDRPDKRIDPERIWQDLERRKIPVEKFEEEEVFKLSQREADQCTFEITDQNYRTATCTFHQKKFEHGVRLFPPHLFSIDPQGKLLRRKDTSSAWERWRPLSQRKVDK